MASKTNNQWYIILIGLTAALVMAMLGIIPAAYLTGIISLKINTADYASSQAGWGGVPMMMAYIVVCVITFLFGFWKSKK